MQIKSAMRQSPQVFILYSMLMWSICFRFQHKWHISGIHLDVSGITGEPAAEQCHRQGPSRMVGGLEGWQTDGSHKFYTALKPIRLKEWPVSWVGRVSAAGAFPSNFPRSSRCIDLCQSRFANNSEGLLMPLLHFSMPLRWCWCPWCCHNGSNLRVKLDMLQRLTKLVTCSFFIPGILKVGGVY